VLSKKQKGSHPLDPAKSDARITALQQVARAMYDNTQAQLEKLGIEEITLWRGSNRAEAKNWPDESVEEGTEVSINSNACSSWSTDKEWAMPFRDAKAPAFFKTVVPRASVFSTAISGLGCLREKEVVVLGVGGKAQAWGTKPRFYYTSGK
jgi:hypothetical protein